jgi:hypothetical protein
MEIIQLLDVGLIALEYFISEMMDGCAKVHTVAHNNMEVDE